MSVGRWVKLDGRCRCSECGALVDDTWRWFPQPGRWTLAYCEACVTELLEVAGGAR